MVLSLPAAMMLIGLFLAVTPPITGMRLPSLLMVFPLWMGIACASYLMARARTAAAVLIGISLVSYGLIQWLKSSSVVGV